MKQPLATASVLVAFALAPPADAAVLLPGDAADGEINSNGVIVGDGLARDWNIVGARGNNANGSGLRNLVYVFDVSSLPADATLGSVSLNVIYREAFNTGQLPTGYALDAYFVGFSSTAALNNDAPTDLTYTADNAGDGIKIADDFLVLEALPANNTALQLGLGDTNLLNALRNRETDGSENFAYFRINPDVALPAGGAFFRGFAIYHQDVSTESQRPFLEATVIPEPGSFGLLSLGTALIFARRRRS